jgi:hypothetical protein
MTFFSSIARRFKRLGKGVVNVGKTVGKVAKSVGKTVYRKTKIGKVLNSVAHETVEFAKHDLGLGPIINAADSVSDFAAKQLDGKQWSKALRAVGVPKKLANFTSTVAVIGLSATNPAFAAAQVTAAQLDNIKRGNVGQFVMDGVSAAVTSKLSASASLIGPRAVAALKGLERTKEGMAAYNDVQKAMNDARAITKAGGEVVKAYKDAKERVALTTDLASDTVLHSYNNVAHALRSPGFSLADAEIEAGRIEKEKQRRKAEYALTRASSKKEPVFEGGQGEPYDAEDEVMGEQGEEDDENVAGQPGVAGEEGEEEDIYEGLEDGGSLRRQQLEAMLIQIGNASYNMASGGRKRR